MNAEMSLGVRLMDEGELEQAVDVFTRATWELEWGKRRGAWRVEVSVRPWDPKGQSQIA